LLNTRKNSWTLVLQRPLAYASLVLLLTALTQLPVHAVEVPTLFTAEVPFVKQSDNPRADAYKAALIKVLARVSGSALAANNAAIDELFPVPAAYVTQYRPGSDDTLWVTFDGEAIENVLRNAGQTVWGRDRPLTLVWLAVDWGQGEREIVAASESDRLNQQSRSIDRNLLLRQRVLDIAEERGLPLAFPLLDAIDLQSVAFSDIWGGFDERIIAASKRYDANSVLIGRVQPSTSQQDRWTYVFGGETRTWSGTAEAVISQIADLLAGEFAVGGNAPLEKVTLNVSGIQTVDAYGALQKLLAGVNLIENFRIQRVAGDTVSYQVEVRGGAARLRRALRFAGLLEQEDNSQEDNSRFTDAEMLPSLEFFYSP
jgi:hypothetical protein